MDMHRHWVFGSKYPLLDSVDTDFRRFRVGVQVRKRRYDALQVYIASLLTEGCYQQIGGDMRIELNQNVRVLTYYVMNGIAMITYNMY